MRRLFPAFPSGFCSSVDSDQVCRARFKKQADLSGYEPRTETDGTEEERRLGFRVQAV